MSLTDAVRFGIFKSCIGYSLEVGTRDRIVIVATCFDPDLTGFNAIYVKKK